MVLITRFVDLRFRASLLLGRCSACSGDPTDCKLPLLSGKVTHRSVVITHRRCILPSYLWSNVWVCRHFSSCLSCLIHIYINITEIYHCRNFAPVRGSFRRSRFFCSCRTRSTLRVHLTSFAVLGVIPEWIASKPPSRLLKVKAVIESVS